MLSNTFEALSLSEPILRALADAGYEEPTPIQQEAIPQVFAGRDLFATAQTGTGKTAAFVLPMLQMLAENSVDKGPIRALIITPTRELALQIQANIAAYSRYLRLKSTVVLGGVSSVRQIQELKRRPAILVATPGRLLDLQNQGFIRLDHVEIFVLDEADRMLDMGFVHDVRRITKLLPVKRQTLMFSATLSSAIESLASGLVKDPVRIEVAPPSTVAENIDQRVLFVDQTNKRDLLNDILKDESVRRALVFARTRRQADRIMHQLSASGISAEAIHSDKTQGARQRALADFDRGKVRVLVGTDIVARGIDVDGISHVINYTLPEDPENYVHRIGRTARAGAEGIALSLCDAAEIRFLRGIEKSTNCRLVEMDDHPYHSSFIASLRAPISKPSVPAPPFGRRKKPRSTSGRRASR